MAADRDLFVHINNAIIDLQSAAYNTLGRPLKTLGRLLHHDDLKPFNATLTAGLDYDAFIAASEETHRSMAGSASLAWPDDPNAALGLTLLMVDRLAEDPEQLINFAHEYFYASGSVEQAIRAFCRQVLIPFARDYRAYVLSNGSTTPQLVIPQTNKVFIVHGHDEAAKEGLARFLEKLGLEAIVLSEQPNQGRTIIEKFEASASEVGYAVVLLTPDDVAGAARDAAQAARARQNVIFELGYFAGKLGRGRVCLLRKGDVDMPSDLFGVVYTDMDASGGWKPQLVTELKAAKLDFDANRMWS